MLVLNNTATAATYPQTLGTGCSLGATAFSGILNVQVYNATVMVRLYVLDDPTGKNAVRGYHPLEEFPMTPQQATFQGVVGFAMRSYAAATPAVVIATLTEQYDPVSPGGVPLTGTISSGQVTPQPTLVNFAHNSVLVAPEPQASFNDSATGVAWTLTDTPGVEMGIVGALPGTSAFTPALTASITNPTLGTGSTVSGEYTEHGKLVQGVGIIIFGTAGVVNGSGVYAVKLPVVSNVGNTPMGNVWLFDSSTGAYEAGMLVGLTTTTAYMVRTQVASSSVTDTLPWSWAASDQIYYNFTYAAL